MTGAQNVRVEVKCSTQIVGLGEEIVGVEITIIIDGKLAIKQGSNMIVQVNLTTAPVYDEIQIVQNVPVKEIQINNDGTEGRFKLKDVLWVRAKDGELEITERSALIYYVSENT